MAKQKKPQVNKLQANFLKLSSDEQVGVTNFFNLHNAAHYVYDHLSEEAQKYVSYCISLSTKADTIEEEQETYFDKKLKEESAQGV